jgi:hypothetical protein
VDQTIEKVVLKLQKKEMPGVKNSGQMEAVLRRSVTNRWTDVKRRMARHPVEPLTDAAVGPGPQEEVEADEFIEAFINYVRLSFYSAKFADLPGLVRELVRIGGVRTRAEREAVCNRLGLARATFFRRRDLLKILVQEWFAEQNR